MPDPNHQSPNAIPPRRSSTGYLFQQSSENPSKPVLKPVPEASWMAPTSTGNMPNGISYSPTDPAAPNGITASAYSTYFSRVPSPPSKGKNVDFSEAVSIAIHANATTWDSEKEKIVLGPYDYIFDNPGKDIRKQLIAAFNAWLKVPEATLKVITKVVGMLHTASLLIDDVEDSSELRRGVPVAHSIFGNAQTINSANYVYFAALQELIRLGNPKLIQIYTDELCNLHRGQGMELFWRDTLTCPTEQDYLEMVSNKTGGLFRLAIHLMQAESESDT